MKEPDISESIVWIIEDDKGLKALLAEEVEDAGFRAVLMDSAEEAVRLMEKGLPDLIVSDLKLPGIDGLNFLKKILSSGYYNFPPGFLIITAFGTIPKAVEALKAGADDFLTKPLDLEHFMLSVKRVLEKKRLQAAVMEMRGLLSAESFHGIYGKSAPMRRLFDQIRQVSSARGPVLILGESGTGKELVARAIHNESEGRNGVFVPVNCAGIPEHLLESEFFGHARGAFTGAEKSRKGIFAEADGGTLLLDEISEMPLALQAKLLRIIQDGSIRRIGENREEVVDVKIVAATHRDIDEDVRLGNFREDLFFRLETFTIKVPPLRERGEDIEFLAARFMKQFSLALDKPISGFTPDALKLLEQYPFPGNVRELSNAIERAVTFSTDSWIHAEHLPSRIRKFHTEPENFKEDKDRFNIENQDFISLKELERRYIKHVLEKTGGNKRQAAGILGIGRKTLYRRL
ncbi:MAG: sigma-54-dependent transcriptional regulator [Thermodesulfobacteriota bacterium]